MSKVGFIGVGTMGCPMAVNIVSKGHELNFYDPMFKRKIKTNSLVWVQTTAHQLKNF